jgi:hypothetical protein
LLTDQKTCSEVLGKPNNHEVAEAGQLQPGFYEIAGDLQFAEPLKSVPKISIRSNDWFPNFDSANKKIRASNYRHGRIKANDYNV